MNTDTFRKYLFQEGKKITVTKTQLYSDFAILVRNEVSGNYALSTSAITINDAFDVKEKIDTVRFIVDSIETFDSETLLGVQMEYDFLILGITNSKQESYWCTVAYKGLIQ